MDERLLGIGSQAVHAAQRTARPGPVGDLPVPPLVMNSAVLLDSVAQGLAQLTREEEDNYAYRRYANPTVRLLEQKWALLEGASDALGFSSGMTACYATFRALVRSGEHVLTQHSLYHEISDQLRLDQEMCGIDVTFLTDYSIDSFVANWRPNTTLVFVESPTNPGLIDVDLPALANLCRERGATLIVDNTMLTALLQRPLDLGADLSLHSTTKTINGHGDAVGGLVASNRDDLLAKLKSFRDNTGTIMDPMAAWLTTRGLRTLPLRLRTHGENADRVAAYLRSRTPTYPTIAPQETPHAATNGVTANPGIVVFTLPSREQATRFIEGVRLMRIGTTFGNLESLVYHFGTFARPSRDLGAIGLDYGLVRLSVGIEDVDDIIADLEQALSTSERAGQPSSHDPRGVAVR
jgi:cystathionine beta-lyase/cystathionine gamma-synthase